MPRLSFLVPLFAMLIFWFGASAQKHSQVNVRLYVDVTPVSKMSYIDGIYFLLQQLTIRLADDAAMTVCAEVYNIDKLWAKVFKLSANTNLNPIAAEYEAMHYGKNTPVDENSNLCEFPGSNIVYHTIRIKYLDEKAGIWFKKAEKLAQDTFSKFDKSALVIVLSQYGKDYAETDVHLARQQPPGTWSHTYPSSFGKNVAKLLASVIKKEFELFLKHATPADTSPDVPRTTGATDATAPTSTAPSSAAATVTTEPTSTTAASRPTTQPIKEPSSPGTKLTTPEKGKGIESWHLAVIIVVCCVCLLVIIALIVCCVVMKKRQDAFVAQLEQKISGAISAKVQEAPSKYLSVEDQTVVPKKGGKRRKPKATKKTGGAEEKSEKTQKKPRASGKVKKVPPGKKKSKKLPEPPPPKDVAGYMMCDVTRPASQKRRSARSPSSAP